MKITTIGKIYRSPIPTVFLCFFFWSSIAWCHSSTDQSKEEFRKVYVTPEEIDVTDEGIFYYDVASQCYSFCKTLSYDKNGLFLISNTLERGPYGLHNVWCKYCGGCGVIFCPMKCDCPNGVGGYQP